MTDTNIIMNFSNIYRLESFYQNEQLHWIDCSGIRGTDCYCDEEAQKQLAEKIKNFPPNGIHFIDSGNYHYMSRLWTDKIRIPFTLVVFDHHPDMQPSLFGNLMSCGCWVKEVLDTNPFVWKVVIVGADNSLLDKVEKEYQNRMICYGEQELNHEEAWQRFANENIEEPVYLSIDKDVLNSDIVSTNWDQGTLTLEDLKKLIGIIRSKQDIIGADICGECSDKGNIIPDQKSIRQNDEVNKELLNFLLDQWYHCRGMAAEGRQL